MKAQSHTGEEFVYVVDSGRVRKCWLKRKKCMT